MNMKSAATVGMFDGVHLGHRLILDFLNNEAQKRGLAPTVVTFNDHPRRLLDPNCAPGLLTLSKEKTELLKFAGCENVVSLDFSPELRNTSARGFITMLRDHYGVSLLVKGYNNRFGHDKGLSFEDYCRIGKEEGVEVIEAPELRTMANEKICSTNIRKALQTGNICLANEMLGRSYLVGGLVGHGKQLGRELGFPTANLVTESPFKLIPGSGVYACIAKTEDGKEYGAMVNIGSRPTVDSKGDVSIEANLIGFNGILYGKPLFLEFVERLRNERKFNSLEDLKNQLGKDRFNTIEILNKHNKLI